MSGTEINSDGTSVFKDKTCRGSDLDLISLWHGANDPTAENNQIPTDGIFLNTTDKLLKINTGTVEAPIWKILSDPSYGNSEIDKVFVANENIDSGFYRNLTINEGVAIKGNTSVLVLYVNDTLTINGTLSQSGINNPATRNLDHSSGNGGANGSGSQAGSDGQAADVLFLPLIPSGKPLKTDIVPYSTGAGGNGGSGGIGANGGSGGIGSGAIYIFAKNIMFGANGSISASGTGGTRGDNSSGLGSSGSGGGGGGAGGIIIITTPTALTADQKAKIISGNSNGSNGANGTANNGGNGGAGGKARLVEFIV